MTRSAPSFLTPSSRARSSIASCRAHRRRASTHPYAVFQYVRAIHEHVPGGRTSCFSTWGARRPTFLCTPRGHRGRNRPARTARTRNQAYRRGRPRHARFGGSNSPRWWRRVCRSPVGTGVTEPQLKAHAAMLTQAPGFLPCSNEDKSLDTLLAGLPSAMRQRVTSAAGCRYSPRRVEVQVQTGRNLTHVGKIIGSGGWLSRAADFEPAVRFAAHAIDARGRRVLMPHNFVLPRRTVSLPTARQPGTHLPARCRAPASSCSPPTTQGNNHVPA